MKRLFLLVVLVVAACGGDDGNDAKSQCNPLGGQGCLLPWPSMAYDDDAPRTSRSRGGDADERRHGHRRSGAAEPLGRLLADRPDARRSSRTASSGDNLPAFKNPDASLAADSPIVLLDVDTGERAPFFAEIDQNTIEIRSCDR